MHAVISVQGGLAVSGNGQSEVLPLTVAGLMSDDDVFAVADQYSRIDQRAKEYGRLTLPGSFYDTVVPGSTCYSEFETV